VACTEFISTLETTSETRVVGAYILLLLSKPRVEGAGIYFRDFYNG